MTEQKHTPETWANRNGRIYQADREVLTIANIARAFDGDYSEANARRIVACVNACAGISTEVLEYNAMHGGVAGLEQQRDQLRAALDKLYNAMDSCTDLTPDVMWQARAALAATEGV